MNNFVKISSNEDDIMYSKIESELENHQKINDAIDFLKRKDCINDKIYNMGLYISFGQNIHNANIDSAYKFENLKTFKAIHDLLEKNDKLRLSGLEAFNY